MTVSTANVDFGQLLGQYYAPGLIKYSRDLFSASKLLGWNCTQLRDIINRICKAFLRKTENICLFLNNFALRKPGFHKRASLKPWKKVMFWITTEVRSQDIKSELTKEAKKRNSYNGLNLPSLVVSGTQMKKNLYMAFMFRPKLYKTMLRDTNFFKWTHLVVKDVRDSCLWNFLFNIQFSWYCCKNS